MTRIMVLAMAAMPFLPMDAHTEELALGPFYWIYKFDGTDAVLFGGATKLGESEHRISLTFECSKKRVLFQLSGKDFQPRQGAEFSGTATIRGGNVEISSPWGRGSIMKMTHEDREADREFVKDIFGLTASLFRDDVRTIVIDIRHPESKMMWDFRYSVGPFNQTIRRESEIGRFRETCARWWDDLL
jgi:hypothetical protein